MAVFLSFHNFFRLPRITQGKNCSVALTLVLLLYLIERLRSEKHTVKWTLNGQPLEKWFPDCLAQVDHLIEVQLA